MVDAKGNWVDVNVEEPYAHRYKFGALEDGAALQVAISTVVNALADNRLDIGRASTLLYGLQLATTNLRTFQAGQPQAAPDALPENAAESQESTQPQQEEELTANPNPERILEAAETQSGTE